ncbi:MAG TPA: RsmD family RNA methyltransferase, partial [Clostridiales bacterium]|nr:RsmD family RNA methyltransferase [Clostridiales bacterium]
MRVITGSARGRVLKALSGDSVRPTGDRAKEGIFSAVQFDIEGRRVLDLFAGSGQLGIEALSRGAAEAVFVDADAAAAATVRENLLTTGLGENAQVVRSDAIAYLRTCADTFGLI